MEQSDGAAIQDQINANFADAIQLKEQRQYIEALKVFDSLHSLIKQNGGAIDAPANKDSTDLQKSYEAVCREIAIICNVLAMAHLSTEEAQGFYAVHAERPFYNDLVEFMTSGPVMIQVLEGEDAIVPDLDRLTHLVTHAAFGAVPITQLDD